MPKNKIIIQRIFLVVLSALIALAVFEVLLSFFRPQKTFQSENKQLIEALPSIYVDSDFLPYDFKKNYNGRSTKQEFSVAVRTNNEGYRDRELIEKSDKNFRILAIGDSFTFGFGVEANESWSKQLESKLNKAIITNKTKFDYIDVINCGMKSGYTFDTYNLFIKNIGIDLKPDLVIITIFENDFLDRTYLSYTKKATDGMPLQIRDLWTNNDQGNRVFRDKPFRYKVPILRNMHTFQLVYDFYYRYILKNNFKLNIKTNTIIYSKEFNEEIYQLISNTEKFLTKNNCKVCFALIPSSIRLAEQKPAPPQFAYDLYEPLKEFLLKEHIPFIDLYPYFKGKDNYYFKYDGHWNNKGHEEFANILTEKIIQNIVQEQ